MFLSLLILVVFIVSLLGLIFVEIVFRNHVGWQDFISRSTLLFTLLIPAVIITSFLVVPQGAIQLAWLEPVDQVNHPVASKTMDDEIESEKKEGKNESSESTRHPEKRRFYSVDASDKGNALKTSPAQQLDQATSVVPDANKKSVTSTNTLDSRASQSSNLVSIVGRSIRVIWVLVSLGIGICYLIGWITIQRLLTVARQNSLTKWNKPVRDLCRRFGCSRQPLLFASDQISTPLVTGIFKPVILIPSRLAVLPCDDLRVRAILSHEIAHIERKDSLWNMLACLSTVLWWPLPTIHFLRKRLTWVREILCDSKGANLIGIPDYAQSLLKLAIKPPSRVVDSLTLPMSSATSTMGSRIQWILDNSIDNLIAPRPNRLIRVALLVLTISALVVGATIRLVPVLGSASDPISIAQDDQANLQTNQHVVRGIVQDSSGQPANRAKVYLHRRISNRLPRVPVIMETDENGKFEFTEVVGGNYQIWAEGDGLTTLQNWLSGERFQLSAEPQIKEFDLKLHAGCDYNVEVVSAEDQTPIENAEITFGWPDIDRLYKSDRAGVAKVRGLARNEWYFIVRAKGFATSFYKAAKQELGTTTTVRFELKPGAKVTGSIIDQEGEPVGGARIFVVSNELVMSPNFSKTETDMQGRFECDGIPYDHKLRLAASRKGYEFESLEFKIDKAEETHLEIQCERLPYGGDAIFTVLDDKNNPVEGATIVNTGQSSGDRIQASTDANGQARLADMRWWRANNRCKVRIRAKGMIPVEMNVNTGTKEEPAHIEVKLETGHTLRGQLIDPDGEPIPGIWVFPMNSNYGDGPFYSKQVTDQEGRFTIAEGMPKNGTLTIYTPSKYEWIESLPVEVSDEELVIQAQMASIIRLRAVDAVTKEPIPAFNVKIGSVDPDVRKETDKRPRRVSATSRNPGFNIHGDTKEYRLEGQTAGTVCEVIVSADGYQDKKIPRMDVVRGDQAELIDIELEPINRD